MQGRKTYRATYDGAKIARDMMRVGWTQRQLSVEAGISETAVSRLVNGRPVGPATALAVAKALEHPLARYQRVRAVADDDEDAKAQLSD